MFNLLERFLKLPNKSFQSIETSPTPPIAPGFSARHKLPLQPIYCYHFYYYHQTNKIDEQQNA